MKILEAQSATLTNYEVYTHLTEQKARYEKDKRRGPGNYEIVVKELLDYLRTPPNPLGEVPLPYNKTTIATLITRLRPYALTKAEVMQILNHRPATVQAVDSIVEEFDSRIEDEEERETMVRIIKEVLGEPDQVDVNRQMARAKKEAEELDLRSMVETDGVEHGEE